MPFDAQRQSFTEWYHGDPKELRQFPKGPNFVPDWDLHAERILLNIFKKFLFTHIIKAVPSCLVVVSHAEERERKMTLGSPKEKKE